MHIRSVDHQDVAQLTEIYNWYISNTIITFELVPISSSEMQRRIQDKVAKYTWLVGVLGQEVIGYAYYGAFHPRAAYEHTVEMSIYLAQTHLGQGFGKALYGALIRSAEEQNFRELVGIIALPNQGSIALHRSLGFEEIGILKRVGYKFDRYIDVAIWQKSIAPSFS